jgi:ABC-type glycerol-3-phosphate transport system substrate-binding protein
MKYTRAGIALATSGVLALGLAACGSSGSDSASADGKVKITVGGLPDKSKAEERKAFEAELTEFKAANPDIDITATEDLWDQQTFSAQLAGGTLPTVIDVPYGELPGLMQRGQVRDITTWVEGNETFADISAQLVATATDADGVIYGVPTEAYSIGIMINRDLFQQAGLDPNTPFTDWDELRAAAKTITEKTGKQGYGLPAQEGYGGWLLSSTVPGFGSNVMVKDGDTYVADLEASGVVDALTMLKAMKWEDNSLGANALPSDTDINNMFAAGDLAMTPKGGDAYQNMTLVLKFPKENYGMLPMPQNKGGLGTSGGGRISILRPDATDAQVDAVVKWIEFHRFARYASEEAAVKWAKARQAEGLPVPEVGLPMVADQTWTQFLEWIKPYSNVPMDNIAPYIDSAGTLPIVPEPMFAAQDLFDQLDVAIQAVLGRQDADIPALLKSAQATVEPIVEQAQQG